MAVIDQYLQQILDATYGEEVRHSIHDAILQNYIDVTETVRLANEAASNANTAAQNADTKAALADTAATNADEKATLADTKATLADTAATNANEKATLANTAAQNADTKATLADTAATNANEKATLANTAATNANEKATLANTAAANADTKASLANTAAQNADTKAALADTAAQNADTKAALADTAAQNANTARDAANTAATNANEKANLADMSAARANQAAASAENMTDIKADIIVSSASGAIASFSDGADDLPVKKLVAQIEPVQDLHGYDHPWPAGGGVNKLNPAEMLPSSSVLGFTMSIDGDDFVISGTYNGSATDPQFRFTRYTDLRAIPYNVKGFAVDNATAEHFVNIRKVDDNTNLVIVLNNCVQGETYNFRIRIVAYEGDTAPTAWTPYSNICPITGWTGAKVMRTGKNLLNPNFNDYELIGNYRYLLNVVPQNTLARFTFTDKDTSISLDGYTIGFCDDSVLSGGLPANFRLAVNNGIIQSNTTNLASSGVLCRNIFIYPNTSGGFNKLFSRWNIMVELGSTATEYEPYQGEAIPITFPSEAGTVYGGTLTVNEDGTGTLVVDRTKIALQALSWVKWSNNDYTFNASIGQSIKAKNQRILCDAYKTLISNDTNWADIVRHDMVIFHPLSSQYILCRNTNINDTSVFRESIQGKNLVYHLATPVTYTLSAEQVRTLLGENHIWADTGDVDVSYRVDTKLYIDGKISEAIANALNA